MLNTFCWPEDFISMCAKKLHLLTAAVIHTDVNERLKPNCSLQRHFRVTKVWFPRSHDNSKTCFNRKATINLSPTLRFTLFDLNVQPCWHNRYPRNKHQLLVCKTRTIKAGCIDSQYRCWHYSLKKKTKLNNAMLRKKRARYLKLFPCKEQLKSIDFEKRNRKKEISVQ